MLLIRCWILAWFWSCSSSLSFWTFLKLALSSCSSRFASPSSTYRGQQHLYSDRLNAHQSDGSSRLPCCSSHVVVRKCLLTVHGSFSICASMWVMKEVWHSSLYCKLSISWCRIAAHKQLYLELNGDCDVLWVSYFIVVFLSPELHF